MRRSRVGCSGWKGISVSSVAKKTRRCLSPLLFPSQADSENWLLQGSRLLEFRDVSE